MDEPQRCLLIAERPGGLRAGDSPAFVPACGRSNEPWGLNPTKKVHEVTARGSPPPSLTAEHCRLVKELEETCKTAQQQAAQAAEAAKHKKQAVAEFGAKLRTAILNNENLGFWKAANGHQAESGIAVAHEPDANLHNSDQTVTMPTTATIPPQANAQSASLQQATTQQNSAQLYETKEGLTKDSKPADTEPIPGHAKQPAPNKKRAQHKPAWATSTTQAEQATACEEQELLAFVEDLDFDSFLETLDDNALKQELQALQELESCPPDVGKDDCEGGKDKAWRKQFVRALNHVSLRRALQHKEQQQQREDADEQRSVASHVSRCTMSSLSKAQAGQLKAEKLAAEKDGKPSQQDWDASTTVGSVKHDEQDGEASACVGDFLRFNPDLKTVHSPASVKAMLMGVVTNSG